MPVVPSLSLCLAKLQEAAKGLGLTNCTSIYFVELQSLTEYRWPFLLYPCSAARGKNKLISKHGKPATWALCHLAIASFPLQHLLPAWLRMLSRVWLCMLILADLCGGLFYWNSPHFVAGVISRHGNFGEGAFQNDSAEIWDPFR